MRRGVTKMSPTISNRAKKALEGLDQTLLSFARDRNPEWLVGQFLDGEGRSSEQCGIYGMGSWIALTERESLRHVQQVDDLRGRCKDTLKQWAADSGKDSEPEKKNISYLHLIVPKICYAYLGLITYRDDAANELLTRIVASQHSSNGWNFVANAAGESPVVTALVVRTFGLHEGFKDQLSRALVYLDRTWKDLQTPYLRLYVLNTIWQFGGNDKRKEIEKDIKETIFRLMNQAFYNPTRFPNPINIDYND